MALGCQKMNYKINIEFRILNSKIMQKICMLNLLAPELFFLILAHSVYKM